MAVIRMQPEEVLQQKADSLQKLMVDTLSAVLRSATQALGATLTAAADNPSDPAWRRAEAEWMAAVSGEFFPRVVEAYADAADDIHLQLVELYGGPAERVPYVANEYAMEYLTDTANRMVNTTEGTWARARAQLIQGFAEGESIEELSARLTEVTDWSRSRAATVARTEIISASNAGALAEVRSVNPDASKEWMATKDSRTREWHREADGETVLLGGTFTVGGEELDFPGDPSGRPDNIINCVIGSTLVDASRIKVVMRSWFDGEIFTIRTTTGKTLSVTPNHPILTLTGLKSACDLQVGDNVVCGDLRHGMSASGDVQRGPTEIANIYRAASVLGESHRVAESVADFHGERRDADVYVVAEEGSLGINGQTSSPEDLDKFVFTATNQACTSFRLSDHGVVPLDSSGRIADSSLTTFRVGIGGAGTSSVDVLAGHKQSVDFGLCEGGSSSITKNPVDNRSTCTHGLRNRGDELPGIMSSENLCGVDGGFDDSGCCSGTCDSSVSQMPSHDLARDSELSGDVVDGESVLISTDRIIEIERRTFVGHVYNLATGGGWYISNGIIGSNCRCTMAFHVPKEALQVAVDDLDELPDVSDEFDPSEFMDFEFLEASASREERTFDESRVRRDHAGKFVKKDSADDTQEIRDAEITPVLTVAPSVSLVEVLQSRMPEDLREYWLRGPGAAIVGWGTTGSFRRCVSNLREHFPQDPEGLCANLYHEATGHWPGEKREK